MNEAVFDLPVTVTMVQADGRSTDVVVVMTERRIEQTIPTTGRVRQVSSTGLRRAGRVRRRKLTTIPRALADSAV